MRPPWSGSWRGTCAPMRTRATCTRPTRACSRVEPLAVAFPRDADDVARAVRVAAGLGVPIVPRGGGTSLAGQTAGGRGLVLDLSRHMNAIEAIDADARTVRVQPGVVQEQLNRAVETPRARVRARHLDLEPGDARRHDRQQLLRQRVDRLRHDRRPRAGARGRARRRLAGDVLGDVGAGQRARAAHPRRRPAAAARPRAGDRRGLPAPLAPVGRLPARPPGPVRPRQARSSAPRARWRSSPRRRSGSSSCRRRRCSRSGTSTRCWARSTPPTTRSSCSRTRSR